MKLLATMCIHVINYFDIVPTGAPLSLSATVIDSRTVLFSWEQPLEELRNGIIRQYHITISEVDTGRQLQLVSTAPSISIPSLHLSLIHI